MYKKFQISSKISFVGQAMILNKINIVIGRLTWGKKKRENRSVSNETEDIEDKKVEAHITFILKRVYEYRKNFHKCHANTETQFLRDRCAIVRETCAKNTRIYRLLTCIFKRVKLNNWMKHSSKLFALDCDTCNARGRTRMKSEEETKRNWEEWRKEENASVKNPMRNNN